MAALALIVAVACVRVARTWSVFAATADEPQHIAAGIEWHARTDIVQHEPWRTVNPPVARIAVGLRPYLAGTQSTPFLRDTLYTGPGYVRNLVLARPGVLPFLALLIVLTLGARATRLRRGRGLGRRGRRLLRAGDPRTRRAGDDRRPVHRPLPARAAGAAALD